MKRIDWLRSPAAVAAALNLPLLFVGLHRTAFDTYFHIFLADHYRRWWFTLKDLRWYTGFSVASYPPLVHQLIALISYPAAVLPGMLAHLLDWPGVLQKEPGLYRYRGEEIGYALVLLACFSLLPVVVRRFAQIFVGKRAAWAAAWLSLGLPGVWLSAYSFGQLPTLVASVTLLWTASVANEFLHTASIRNFIRTILWAALVAAMHHAVLLFALPLGLALVWRAGLKRIPRAFIIGIFAVAAGAVVLWPFLQWAADYQTQIPIDHPSRHDFLRDPGARLYFFWPMLGVLLALLPWTGRLAIRSRRLRPLGLLVLLLWLFSLGGTTSLPRWTFGENWNWLTYDRFGLWSGLALLPIAGLAWSFLARRMRNSPTFLKYSVATIVGLVLASVSIWAAALSWTARAQPQIQPLNEIAAFLAEADHSQYRYLTLGFGDQLARLSVLTDAPTLDGTYHTARRLFVLQMSGLGALDKAVWSGGSARAVFPILAHSKAWNLRFVFSAHPEYILTLVRAGWTPLTSYRIRACSSGNGRRHACPDRNKFPAAMDSSAAGIWWGLAPLAVLLAALAIEFAPRLRGFDIRAQLPMFRLRLLATATRRLALLVCQHPLGGDIAGCVLHLPILVALGNGGARALARAALDVGISDPKSPARGYSRLVACGQHIGTSLFNFQRDSVFGDYYQSWGERELPVLTIAFFIHSLLLIPIGLAIIRNSAGDLGYRRSGVLLGSESHCKLGSDYCK